MDEDLRTEILQLRKQLRAFLAQARQNEAKMRRFEEQELQLIGTRSFAGLIHTLIYNYRTTFELDLVTLLLVDPEYECRCILEESGSDLLDTPGLILSSDFDSLDNLYGMSLAPILGSYDRDIHNIFFPHQKNAPVSVALLPLVRQGRLIGSLNLGSFHSERFIAGIGTDFLVRLASIVAICVENALNHERLERIGLTDPLTRVNNRRYFEQRLKEEVSNTMRYKSPLGCMFIDIDRFKNVNDSLGHAAGDEVLKSVAGLINEQLRSGDVIARYGGEEFVVLLPNTASRDAAEIAERVRSSVGDQVLSPVKGRSLRISVSIGVASLIDSSSTGNPDAAGHRLVEAADRALFDAKRAGRNRVVNV